MTTMTNSITKTKETWQESYVKELTDDDALEITANLIGFFVLLQEWEQETLTSNERRRDNGYGDF